MKLYGEVGWFGLFLYVWAWDATAAETLSNSVWRALKRPVGRWVAIGAWAYVTSHLFFRKPKRILIIW